MRALRIASRAASAREGAATSAPLDMMGLLMEAGKRAVRFSYASSKDFRFRRRIEG